MAFTSRSIFIPRQMRVAFLSSFVPRECGIATFTEDVLNAVSSHGATCKVVAMNRPEQRFAYDRRVVATVREDRRADYLDAAAVINRSQFDVLSVQHEFGIYGGEESRLLTDLLDAVDVPVVSTFHTVLHKPSPLMRWNLHFIANRSQAVVVMNELAVDILDAVYGVDPRKIHVVHHGAPEVPRTRQRTIKADLQLTGKKVISTFGLLSSGKGLEYAIRAMPMIAQNHPEAVYLILGQTHPVVKQEEGEQYRLGLKQLAHDLGVEAHIVFIDKYFTKAEIMAYLQATDIYLTPYPNMEQVTSGTLAYAMACGRPLVSTPYLYAQFLLDEQRGILVPPRDPRSIAEACLQILDHPELQARMERQNLLYGQQMLWPRVGRDYLQLFHRLAGTMAPSASYLRVQAG